MARHTITFKEGDCKLRFDDYIKITFNNDVILNGKIEQTSYFEIKYQENNIYSITFNK